jgi:hypothetical protein
MVLVGGLVVMVCVRMPTVLEFSLVRYNSCFSVHTTTTTFPRTPQMIERCVHCGGCCICLACADDRMIVGGGGQTKEILQHTWFKTGVFAATAVYYRPIPPPPPALSFLPTLPQTKHGHLKRENNKGYIPCRPIARR